MTSEDTVGLVFTMPNPHLGSPPPGNLQRRGRLSVQAISRLLRLDAQPNGVSSPQSTLGPIPDRLVCLLDLIAASEVLLLEPLARSLGHRCLLPELDTVQGICQPFMVSDWEMPTSSAVSGSRIDNGDAGLDWPAYVTADFIPVSGPPLDPPQHRGHTVYNLPIDTNNASNV